MATSTNGKKQLNTTKSFCEPSLKTNLFIYTRRRYSFTFNPGSKMMELKPRPSKRRKSWWWNLSQRLSCKMCYRSKKKCKYKPKLSVPRGRRKLTSIWSCGQYVSKKVALINGRSSCIKNAKRSIRLSLWWTKWGEIMLKKLLASTESSLNSSCKHHKTRSELNISFTPITIGDVKECLTDG